MSGMGFFVVTDGEAAVADGVEVATLSAGDHFGELALITKAERSATVTAPNHLHCLEIAFSDFRAFAYANPDVTWKLLPTRWCRRYSEGRRAKRRFVFSNTSRATAASQAPSGNSSVGCPTVRHIGEATCRL